MRVLEMPNGDVYSLTQHSDSVSSILARDPSKSPSSVCEQHFRKSSAPSVKHDDAVSYDVNENETEVALECGNWGQSRPTKLFLKIYANVLKTLEKNYLQGVCSPSLLGTNGVCPLTIIATIPDVCRHMSNLIARAKHEVFLATNYWAMSEGSRLISNAIKELSRRAVDEQRTVVVKVLYDRGDVKQFIDNHHKVSPSEYSNPKGPIGLPHPDELPNVSIEVMNFHRPLVGLFHAKFAIVDRNIAILQSNNIMDNDNMEMMVQFEGDIVDSLYDMALITWHNELYPPFPCLATPAAGAPTITFNDANFVSMTTPSQNEQADQLQGLRKVASDASKMDMAQHTSTEPNYDNDVVDEIHRTIASLNPKPNESRIESVARLLNGPAPNNETPSAPEIDPEDMITPIIPIAPHDPFPIAMVNRPPHGSVNFHSADVPQNAAFISALRYAEKSIFIQTPDLNAQGLLPEIIAACKRGIKITYYYCLGYNDSGELLPHQGGHNEAVASALLHELNQVSPEALSNLDIYAYVAKDQIRPIHNKFKKRSCHIKLMIVDDHIGIQGSGNQDTQSWYHSQEANVMIDSEFVCRKWMEGIRQNQNTHLYGRVARDGPEAGCWIDPVTGKRAEGSIGVEAGKFSWAKGMIGALKKVRGVGGF